MNVLDSPVDALIFDYVGFGIFTVVNNLWTWVAVLTAAVSFWRFRAAGDGAVKTMLQPPVSSDCIERKVTESSHPEPPTSSASVTKSVVEAPSKPVTKASESVSEDSGVTKGKFVVYYHQDDREKESSVDGDGDGDLTAFGNCGCGGDDGWERMLRLRIGDFGIYNCQDLTVINGNIVRLWDGIRREKYSAGCVVW